MLNFLGVRGGEKLEDDDADDDEDDVEEEEGYQ